MVQIKSIPKLEEVNKRFVLSFLLNRKNRDMCSFSFSNFALIYISWVLLKYYFSYIKHFLLKTLLWHKARKMWKILDCCKTWKSNWCYEKLSKWCLCWFHVEISWYGVHFHNEMEARNVTINWTNVIPFAPIEFSWFEAKCSFNVLWWIINTKLLIGLFIFDKVHVLITTFIACKTSCKV
jgi:hypothetical protein